MTSAKPTCNCQSGFTRETRAHKSGCAYEIYAALWHAAFAYNPDDPMDAVRALQAVRGARDALRACEDEFVETGTLSPATQVKLHTALAGLKEEK